MSALAALPFSPLTHDELNRRHDVELREAGGYIAVTLSPHVADDDPWSLENARKHAAIAEQYHAAAMLRCEVTGC